MSSLKWTLLGSVIYQLSSYTEFFLFHAQKYETEKSWDAEIAEHTRSGATVPPLCAKAHFWAFYNFSLALRSHSPVWGWCCVIRWDSIPLGTSLVVDSSPTLGTCEWDWERGFHRFSHMQQLATFQNSCWGLLKRIAFNWLKYKSWLARVHSFIWKLFLIIHWANSAVEFEKNVFYMVSRTKYMVEVLPSRN